MPRYLSPEWLDAAQAAMGRITSVGQGTAGLDLVVQHVVTGETDGDVTFYVRVGARGAEIRKGEAPDATVVFTEDYDTAAAIGRGDLSAQSAFMMGRIRVRGDLSKLVEQSNVFGEIEDVLAELRAETTY